MLAETSSLDSLVFSALNRGSHDDLSNLLARATPRVKTEHFSTAIIHQDPRMARIFLDSGVDVATPFEGLDEAPLALALRHNKLTTAIEILAYGADLQSAKKYSLSHPAPFFLHLAEKILTATKNDKKEEFSKARIKEFLGLELPISDAGYNEVQRGNKTLLCPLLRIALYAALVVCHLPALDREDSLAAVKGLVQKIVANAQDRQKLGDIADNLHRIPEQHFKLVKDVVLQIGRVLVSPFLQHESSDVIESYATKLFLLGKGIRECLEASDACHTPSNQMPDNLQPYYTERSWYPLFKDPIDLGGGYSAVCLSDHKALRQHGEALSQCLPSGWYTTQCLTGKMHLIGLLKDGRPHATFDFVIAGKPYGLLAKGLGDKNEPLSAEARGFLERIKNLVEQQKIRITEQVGETAESKDSTKRRFGTTGHSFHPGFDVSGPTADRVVDDICRHYGTFAVVVGSGMNARSVPFVEGANDYATIRATIEKLVDSKGAALDVNLCRLGADKIRTEELPDFRAVSADRFELPSARGVVDRVLRVDSRPATAVKAMRWLGTQIEAFNAGTVDWLFRDLKAKQMLAEFAKRHDLSLVDGPEYGTRDGKIIVADIDSAGKHWLNQVNSALSNGKVNVKLCIGAGLPIRPTSSLVDTGIAWEYQTDKYFRLIIHPRMFAKTAELRSNLLDSILRITSLIYPLPGLEEAGSYGGDFDLKRFDGGRGPLIGIPVQGVCPTGDPALERESDSVLEQRIRANLSSSPNDIKLTQEGRSIAVVNAGEFKFWLSARECEAYLGRGDQKMEYLKELASRRFTELASDLKTRDSVAPFFYRFWRTKPGQETTELRDKAVEMFCKAKLLARFYKLHPELIKPFGIGNND